MTFRRSVVIGKFLPPHRGHKLLIDTAAAASERVTVILCAKPSDAIPGELRAEWLREIHPGVDVTLIDDRYDENDTAVWARNTIRWLGSPPDAVFTSEDYGEPYARAMGCSHVLVDRHRLRVPCSATMIRADPFAHWSFIDPPVRGYYAKRVCVLGAESTGTTTLAAALARHYATPCVEEYGREYSAAKQLQGQTRWTTDEFVSIAAEQTRREDAAARLADRLLICDTNSFATRLWHRRYVGRDDPAVHAATGRVRCDLYLLTGDEIPFVQDGLRDGEHLRHAMHRWFEDALREQPVPWLLVRGSPHQRIAQSAAAIHTLFADSAWRPAPYTERRAEAPA